MGIAILVEFDLGNVLLTPRTLQIRHTLGQRSTCSFGLIDPDADYLPVAGNTVTVVAQDEETTLFHGSIDQVDRSVDIAGGPLIMQCTCVDFTQALDRRLTRDRVFTNMKAGAIIRDLNAFLGVDGFDDSLVEDGPTIDSFEPYFLTMSEAFTQVANRAGMTWYITPDDELIFELPGATTAPFSVSEANASTIRATETREDYINRISLRFASGLLDMQTRDFVGDGTTQSWEFEYPINGVSQVRVDGVIKTVGKDGETGKDFYWSPGSTRFYQDPAGTPIGAGVAVAVDYVGIEAFMVEYQDDAAIAARAAVESGKSGIYELYMEVDTALAQTEAQALAQSTVERYSAQVPVVAVYTINDYKEPLVLGLRPGQLQAVSIPSAKVSGLFLIQSISISHQDVDDQSPYQWIYQIEAVQGPRVINYVDFFRNGPGSGSSALALAPGGAGAASGFGGYYVLTPANTVTPTLELGFAQELLLNRPLTTIAAATYNGNFPPPGLEFSLILVQDGSGKRQVAWAAEYGSYTVVEVSGEPGSASVFRYISRANGTFQLTGVPAIGV